MEGCRVLAVSIKGCCLSLFVMTLYFLIDQAVSLSYFPLSLPFFIVMVTLANAMLLRKERKAISVVVMNILLSLFYVLSVVIVSGGKPAVWYLVAYLCMLSLSFYTLHQLTVFERNESMIKTFDLSIFFFIATAIYVIYYSYDISLVYPSVAAAGLSFLSVVYARQSNTRRRKNSIVMLISIIVVTLSVLFLLGHTDDVSNAVIAIFDFFVLLINKIISFFLWLMSFFPRIFPVSVDDTIDFEGGKYLTSDLVITPLSNRFFIIITVTIAILVVCLIAYYLIKTIRIGGGKRMNRNKKTSMNALTFKEAVRQAISSVRYKVITYLFILKNRNNIRGFYFWIDRKLRKSSNARMNGESMDAFLQRLSSCIGCKAEFNEIRELSSLYFYSGKKADQNIKKEASAIRHGLNRYLISENLIRIKMFIVDVIKKNK